MAKKHIEIRVTSAMIWPTDICANCAKREGVRRVESRISKTTAVVTPIFIVGEEKKLVEEIPLCKLCEKTANRVRPTLTEMLVAWGLSFFLLLMLTPLVAASLKDRMPDFGMSDSMWASCVTPVVVSLILPVAWYATRKPREGASSYYQPVFLLRSRRESLLLGFSNEVFARAFVEANPGAEVS